MDVSGQHGSRRRFERTTRTRDASALGDALGDARTYPGGARGRPRSPRRPPRRRNRRLTSRLASRRVACARARGSSEESEKFARLFTLAQLAAGLDGWIEPPTWPRIVGARSGHNETHARARDVMASVSAILHTTAAARVAP
eukprot:30835-Pelagococcus_subviridis.AAC.1